MNDFWQMANLWNSLNACGWKGRTGKENEKTRIFQGCQRDILVTVRCCFRLVIAKKVPPTNPKVAKKVPPANPKVAKKVPPANPTFAQTKVPPYIIINQIYLKRNTNNHMISKNKHKFQVAVEEDRKTQPELARTE